MSPKMQQSTKNCDIFSKFASQRCKAMEALRMSPGYQETSEIILEWLVELCSKSNLADLGGMEPIPRPTKFMNRLTKSQFSASIQNNADKFDSSIEMSSEPKNQQDQTSNFLHRIRPGKA